MMPASGNWWTSTQYNANNGVMLNNGGFNNNNKNNNYNLLPVLECYHERGTGVMEYGTLLDLVYEAYYVCRKNKRRKHSAVFFEWNYERELGILARELADKTYRPTTSIVFPVTRPKHREVFAANFRDRIVHHLLMLQFGELIDREMVQDSYNCRKGKGVFHGQQRLAEEIRRVSKDYTKQCYVLSMDIEGFFMSIDVNRLWQMLETLIRDKYKGNDTEWWLWLFELVVRHRPETDCEVHGDKAILDALPDNKTLTRSKGYGMPIGNHYVQICGNYYLTTLDVMVQAMAGKDGFYCRFVDDMRVVSRDKRLLMRIAREARRYPKDNLHLTLHRRKFAITEVHKGVPFIGCVIMPWGIYTGNRVVGNAFDAFRKAGKPTDKLIASYNSYMGFLLHGKTYGIRWRLYNAIPPEVKNKVICINMRKYALRDGLDNIHAAAAS